MRGVWRTREDWRFATRIPEGVVLNRLRLHPSFANVTSKRPRKGAVGKSELRARTVTLGKLSRQIRASLSGQ
jgi:hypothetical protein